MSLTSGMACFFGRKTAVTLHIERYNIMNIYVGNMSLSISEDSLKALFAEFGEVESAKVVKDRFTARSKGYGFIEMPINSEADQAIKALNGNRIDGRHIKVKPADSGRKRCKKRSYRKRSY